jgi:hypothetical protein
MSRWLLGSIADFTIRIEPIEAKRDGTIAANHSALN